jgi:hypothetical protein
MCLTPAPGLPTEFSSAAVRAEAGESAEGVASRAGKEGKVGGGCGRGRRIRS